MTTTTNTPVVMLSCACGCGVSKPEEQMRVPNWEALKTANNGKRVAVADLKKFALTGACAHKMRERTGIKCFPYLAAVDSGQKAEADRVEAAQKRADDARKLAEANRAAAEKRRSQNSFFSKFVPQKSAVGQKEERGSHGRPGNTAKPAPHAVEQTAQPVQPPAPRSAVRAPDGVQ